METLEDFLEKEKNKIIIDEILRLKKVEPQTQEIKKRIQNLQQKLDTNENIQKK